LEFYWSTCFWGSRRGRDGMVVGVTATHTICAYHHWCCEFESHSGRGVQHVVIMFVSDLWQVCGFLRVQYRGSQIKKTFLNSITFLKKKSITENLDIYLVFYCILGMFRHCDTMEYTCKFYKLILFNWIVMKYVPFNYA
jgi:hypothetical protein